MQLHKRFTTEQVTAILKGYEGGQLTVEDALEVLEIKPATFYKLLKRYRPFLNSTFELYCTLLFNFS